MTKELLRKIREDRGLTRDELAVELKCSAGAIVQWEHGKRAIPQWVEDKLMSSVELALPLADLRKLLDVAISEGLSFEALLAQAVKEYLHARTSKPAAPAPVNTGAAPTKTAPAAASPSTIIPLPPQHFVAAEQAPEYGTKKQPKKG